MADYVNNKDFYKAIVEWKDQCRIVGYKVQQSDFIGSAISKIAHGLSNYWKFSRYSQNWKDDMIADAIEMSVKGLHNFDETRFTNAHAYITQACYNAFLQRIKKEKKAQATIYKHFVDNVYDREDKDMVAQADETFIQDIHNKLNDYESNKKATEKEQEDIVDMLDFLYEVKNED